MEHALLPLSTAIEQEVATIQAEADSITQRGQEENAQVNEELAKLAQLVHVFQVGQQGALFVHYSCLQPICFSLLILTTLSLSSAEPHVTAAA